MTILKKVWVQSLLILLATIMIFLPLLPTVTAQNSSEDGDVNRDGRTTPVDALCVFRRFLGLKSCLDSLGVRTFLVDCAAGETIAQALLGARSGDTIQVAGTCNETIIITTDRLTLDGQDTTVIDGGGGEQAVLTIDGARGVTVARMTVQNGGQGVVARRSSSVILEQVTAQDNTDDGLSIDENSTAQLIDCTVLRNGDDGIRVSRSSSLDSHHSIRT